MELTDQAYHLIGIGGIGMSGLAHILVDMGGVVTGEECQRNFLTRALEKRGVRMILPPLDKQTIVYSSAVSFDHETLQRAKRGSLSILHRSELLATLMRRKRSLLVAGTHGKSSISALLSHLLSYAGLDPSFAIGGVAPTLSRNGRYGAGPYFVVEADESDGSFLRYSGEGGILTNIEEDHLDHWQTREQLIEGFVQFLQQMTNVDLLFWCRDDPILRKMELSGVSYGIDPHSEVRMLSCQRSEQGVTFSAKYGQRVIRRLFIPTLGIHQGVNALAVLGLSLRLGIQERVIRQAFLTFQGVYRRLQKKGERDGVILYDDYAHHPTAIDTTLFALKEVVGSKRVIVIFQPHRYTRTLHLFDQFCRAFAYSDICVITEIYAAGESLSLSVSGKMLLDHLTAPRERYYIERAALRDALSSVVRPGDVLVTMGAGDITRFAEEWLGRGGEE